jgi:hypothetical protein
MNELELNFMFKVAEERGIDPLTVFESLYFNGRQIYVHFMEDRIGIIEAPDGVDGGDDTLTYQIRAGMLKPLAPASRIELAGALGKKIDTKELKIRISLDDSESKYLGNLYIKAIVNLESELVIDYEDFQFIPLAKEYKMPHMQAHPPHLGNIIFEKFADIVISSKQKPHTAYVVVAKTLMKINRGEAWNALVNLAQESKGQTEVTLSGWGKIYLRRTRLNPGREILYSHEQFDHDKTENLPDGVKIFNLTSFDTSWTDHK